MKIRPFLTLFPTFMVVLIGYQNCGDSYKAIDGNIKVLNVCNKISPIAKVTPTPTPAPVTAPIYASPGREKLDKESFKEKRSEKDSGKILTGQVNANQKLSVALDVTCLQTQAARASVFTEDLQVENLKTKVLHRVFTTTNEMSFSDLEMTAQTDDCVLSIAKDTAGEILTSPPDSNHSFNDTRYADQTYMPKINHQNGSILFYASIGILDTTTIAVIDPLGIDILHQDLEAHIWQNTLEALGTTGVDDDNNGYVDDINGYNFIDGVGRSRVTASHGTYIAGFVGAVGHNNNGIAGVMSTGARIMVLQAGGSADIANSFRYAADKGAKIIVISMSTGASDQMRDAIQYAVDKGATVFAAAGNSGPAANSVIYPALYSKTMQGVLAIGMSDANPATDGVICNDSSRDAGFVLGAPGCDTGHVSGGILSTWGDATGVEHNGYNYNRGTSFAAPIAAGAGALAYAYVRDQYGCELTPGQLEALVKSGSKSVPSFSEHFYQGKHIDLVALHRRILEVFGAP